jgi:hypothetical protein
MLPRPRLSLLFLLAACVRTTPQPPPEPPAPPRPAVMVPEGCLASLSGTWVHASDPGYRYEAEDDGGTLTLVVFHVPMLDAGFSPRRFRVDAGTDAGTDAGEPTDAGPLDAGPAPSSVRVELQRTANGFVGATLAPLTHPSGRLCEGRFPTTLISCADGGLLLETQSATALGDACQAPARPLGLLTQQHQLWRPDAG